MRRTENPYCACLGDVAFIEFAESRPKLGVAGQSEIQAGKRLINVFEVVSALLAEVVKMPLLIGLGDEGRNVVEVLRLNRTVLEVPKSSGIPNP